MAFSSGTYTLPGPALSTGDTVSATENNTLRNDMASSFNLTWLRNGTAAATANIPMGGFEFTNAAAIGSNSSLLLKSNSGTTAATIDSAQNVGVGVTPSAWTLGANTKAIDFSYGSLSTSTNNITVTQNGYYNGTNWIYKTTSYASLYNQGSGAHAWYNAPSGTAGNAITFTQAMTLDASGRLLVGLTSGTSGQVIIGSNGASQNALSFVDSNGAGRTFATGPGVGTGTVGDFGFYDVTASQISSIYTGGSSGKWAWYTNGSERARIDSSGNLLVNTTSQHGTAKITASSSATDGIASTQATAGGYCYLANALTNGGTYYFHLLKANGTTTGQITSNGTTTTYATSSDYRLKENIVPMTGHKERLSALQPKQGSWKVDGSEFRGFLAHEFAESYPSSVNGQKDAVDTDGNPQYQGMQAGSSEVIADLVALVQEQQALITSLTERITALETK